MKKFIKALLIVGLLILWVFFSIGAGVLFLAVKESLGWNVFSHTGFHSIKSCLQREIPRTVHKPEAP